MGREILITPNRSTTGSTLEPTISFSGATNGTINLKVEDDGSLVFEGVNGGLFNITDSKSGLLHSVNDVSGLPILSVYSDDRVIAGAYNQNALVVNSDKVGIGIPNPSEKLHVSGITIVNSDYLMLSDTLTTIPALNFKGFVNVQDSDDNIGYFSLNLNTSGETGLFIYNNSVVGGGIQTFGSNHIRNGGPHVVGSDFYRNKILISANNSSDGMVIKPKADDPLATLWFEMDTASVMILKGDGTPGGGNAFLGIALNPDGTEMPSSNLQIGGTGTTGTVQVNQDVLNVNAYNTYGKIRPNFYTIIDSGTTASSPGVYQITINAGWVIEQIQIYTKVPDSVLIAGSLVDVSTLSGNIWFPGVGRPFGLNSNNIVNMLGIYSGSYIEPAYFPFGDTLLISFVDPFGTATNVTDGTYGILITYWDGSEIL